MHFFTLDGAFVVVKIDLKMFILSLKLLSLEYFIINRALDIELCVVSSGSAFSCSN